MTGGNPAVPVVPNTTNIPCILTSPEQVIELGPVPVRFEFDEDGAFQGTFTWHSCPECEHCYMEWDYTMQIDGVAGGETVAIAIQVIHIGHNVQGEYLKTELSRVRDTNQEPRIRCDQSVNCSKVTFTYR